MSLISPSLAARPREDQFIGDLASLFRRYRVRTGTPDCLRSVAPQLQANNSLRSDLFALCNAISRMCESDLTPEELLRLVAKAVGGPAAVSPDSSDISIPAEFAESFTDGFRAWQARIENLPEFTVEAPEIVEAPEEDETWRKANKFAAAASMSSSRSRPAPPAVAPSTEVSPQTPIGELTISELRSYLDEIEQRVDRLQPYLAALRPIPEVLATEPSTVQPDSAESANLVFEEPQPASAIPINQAEAEEIAEPVADKPQVFVTQSLPSTASVAALVSEIAQDRPSSDSQRNKSLTAPDGLHQDETAPLMFRSLTEKQSRSHRGLLWVAAALVMLVPGAYYGKQYIRLQSTPIQVAPPPPPAARPATPEAQDQTAGQSTKAADSTPPSTLASAPRRTSSTHLRPHAVRMAAEAARAEEQSDRR